MYIDSVAWLQDEFPGLLSLVRMYVNSIDMDVDTRCTVLQYLRFISKRASGTKLKKDFLNSHSIKLNFMVAIVLKFDLKKTHNIIISTFFMHTYTVQVS